MTNLNTFFQTTKSARQVDVRSKILILLTLSVAVFFVNGRGLSLLFVLFLLLVVFDYFLEFKDRTLEFATVLKAVLKVAIPLYVICAISFLANAIVIGGDGPCITSYTALRGAFYCGRILLLGWSSLFVANTVSLIEFAAVFKWMFWPLHKLKVPVQDASLAVSIALRFIPEIFVEFQNIREAQWCRGAKMSSGGLITRTQAHAGCFVPLIVRMMSNVDALSDALVTRCWGVFEVSPKEEMDAAAPAQVVFTTILCFSVCFVAILV